MKRIGLILIVVVILLIGSLIFYNYYNKEENTETKEKKTTDAVMTTKKKVESEMDGITINYHASIKMEKAGKVIYFDPFKIDNLLNDADYVFITHSHYDHYSEEDIKKVMKDDTKFIITSDLESKVINLGVSKENIKVVYPNQSYIIDEIKVDTVPSYNINKTYHKKSYNWVGYNVNIGGIKYYIVGDSDVTDEFKSVKCDVIFVPVGGTYTMTNKEAAEAINEMKPKYAVPVHYGETGSKENAENFIKEINEDIKGMILK